MEAWDSKCDSPVAVTEFRGGQAVSIKGLEKSYRDWPVLWDLDLSVRWGETLALFGANGVGKTTLLRILATSVRADSGTVHIAGHDLRRQTSAVRRRIGVVGHRSFLYDDLTARENLVYYARLYGISGRDDRVSAALRQVGLEHRADHRVRALSNGMQRRASIARAILHQPQVLLLDEPETGLDREARQMLGDLLAEWNQEGRSVIFSTHDIDLGLSWSNQVAILRNGSLAFPTGAAAEIQQELSNLLPVRSTL